MSTARAFAKVNLSLQVRSRGTDGYHPIRSIAQSVGWHDTVVVSPSDQDEVSVTGGDAPGDDTNLAWKAAVAVRNRAGAGSPLSVEVHKSIPMAAGLAGGSADAAAALGLAGSIFSVPFEAVADLAPSIGSDVPFCLQGGTALVTGRGENVEPMAPRRGYALAIVVPPILLETPDVYEAWDEMAVPDGTPMIGPRGLPPTLRDLAPLVNDLYAAAASLAPDLDDWRRDLASRWGRPVGMTGAGSALFSFFPTLDEAEDSLGVVPSGARATGACEPMTTGWEIVDDLAA